MRGKLLVVSDRLINGSLKFYSRIATPFAKGGAIVEKIPLKYKFQRFHHGERGLHLALIKA